MCKKFLTWRIVYLFLLILALLLIMRSFFGVDFTDESFYFALAKRFFQGDAVLVDEWFPTQLIGVLLLPFYKLYVLINGNQEGIIVWARIIYVIFSALVSAYMMHVFRKKGESAGYAFLSAAIFCIYVRASIGTFSYYSLGLETFLLTVLFFIDGSLSNVVWKWILAGINFSISVICMPYMVLFFGAAVIICFCRKPSFLRKEGVFCFVGIAIVALIFMFGVGPQIFAGLRNVPEILMDPQHQGSIGEHAVNIISYLCFTYLKFTWPLYALTLLAGIYICNKQILDTRTCIVYKDILYLEFFVQALYSRTFFEGGIVFAFFLLAVQIQLSNFRTRERDWEKYFLIPGLGFGFVWIMGSNVGMRVFNMGILLADVWALKIVIEDSKCTIRKSRYLGTLSIFILFCVLMCNRFFDVYRDGAIWTLDTRVTSGSMKGIFTTAERASEYETVVRELKEYTKENNRLAAPGLNPWIYLESPAKCGAYSVWSVDFTDKRNWSYYERNLQNVPNIIFQLNSSYGKYTSWRFSSHGSNEAGIRSDVEGYLKELLQVKEYEMIESVGGTYYFLE